MEHAVEEMRVRRGAAAMRIAVCLAALMGIVRPAAAQNEVSQWSQHAQAAIVPGRGAGTAEYLFALVHAAMYDAVVAVEGRYQPFRVSVAAPAGASAGVAAAAAAYAVLVARVPAAEPALTAQYAAFLATVPDGPAKSDGMAVGAEVGARWLALRANDGSSNTVTWVQPAPGPGVWEPTAPSTPAELVLTQVTPYVMSSRDQLRPQGPPPLNSARYAAEWLEVNGLGRADSPYRSPQQLEIAQFWAEHTAAQWNRNVRQIAISAALDLVETARLLAVVHVATADAAVGCFDAKYHFLSWRPVHAIQRAGTDGNAFTTADPSWTSLLNVNHPEYPSGHACLTGAVTGVLTSYFGGSDVPVQLDSAFTGTSRSYQRIGEISDELNDARVYAGLHFRAAMKDGTALGRRAALLVLNHHFRPLVGRLP